MGKIVVPMTNQAFYSSEDETLKNISTINKRYGNLIKRASQLTNTPESVISSFIWIESAGMANAKTVCLLG